MPTGTVFDKETSKSLGFANVVLMNLKTDVTFPIERMTNEDRMFVVPNVPCRKYIIRVGMIGNISQEREITVADFEIYLGKIEFAENIELFQEVVVTGHRNQMSVNSECKIFNVSSNIVATGASANELFAAVPSVDVNSDGEILLHSNSDILI